MGISVIQGRGDVYEDDDDFRLLTVTGHLGRLRDMCDVCE
jgi:hypothetical protein